MFTPGYISSLCVSQESRGLGIGNILMSMAEAQNSMKYMKLHVRVNNLPALRLYSKRGYRIVDVVEKYYGTVDAFIMMKCNNNDLLEELCANKVVANIQNGVSNKAERQLVTYDEDAVYWKVEYDV